MREDDVFSIHPSAITRKISLPLASVACGLALALPMPVSAQERPWPSNVDTHPGEIVYSRDVPYGTATRRFVRGEASTISPDKSKLIIDTLMQGLQPMTDAEAAAVSAPLMRSSGQLETAINTGLAPLMGANGNSDFTRSESGGSQTGGIVNQALGALPSALSVIGKTIGGN